MFKIDQPSDERISVKSIQPYIKTRHEVEPIGQPLPLRIACSLESMYEREIPLPVQLTIGDPDPEMEESEESVLAKRYPQLIPVMSAGRDIPIKAPHVDRMLELPFDAAAVIASHLTAGTSATSAAMLSEDESWAKSLKRAVERTWYSRVIDTIMHLLAAGEVMNEFEEVVNRGPEFNLQTMLEAGWQAYSAVYSLKHVMEAWATSAYHLNDIQGFGRSCDLSILMKVAPYLRRHIGAFVPVNLQYFLTALIGKQHSSSLIRRSVDFGRIKTIDGSKEFTIQGRGLVLSANVEIDVSDIQSVDPIRAISNYIYLLGRLDPFVITGHRLKTINELNDTLLRDLYRGMKLPRYYTSQGEELVHDPLLQISHEATVLALLESSFKNASAQENVGVALATRLGLASAQAAEIGAAFHAMYHLAVYPVALCFTYKKLLDEALNELDPWLKDKVAEPVSQVRDAVFESIYNRPAYGETFEEMQSSIPESLRDFWNSIKPKETNHVLANRRKLGQTSISLYVGPGEINVYNSSALSLTQVKSTTLLHKEIAFNTVLEALREVTDATERADFIDLSVRRIPLHGHEEIIRLLSYVNAVVRSDKQFTYYFEDVTGQKPTLLFFPDLDALARHLGYENWEKLRVLVNPQVFEEMTRVAQTIINTPVHELTPQLLESRSIKWSPSGWFGERLLMESFENLYARISLKQKLQIVDRNGDASLEDIPYPFYVAENFLLQRVSKIVAIQRPPKPTRYAADLKPDIVTLVSRPEAPEITEGNEILEPTLDQEDKSADDTQ